MSAETDPAVRLAWLADELHAVAANGLHYVDNPYDRARYEQVRDLAARLLAEVDTRDVDAIAREYRGILGPRSPLVAADAVVFDDAGRLLLIDRSDGGGWCMPGGAVEVGESPAAAAAREAYEETGVTVEPVALVGVYDNRRLPEPAPLHAIHHVYRCRLVAGEPTKTHEAVDVGWFTESDAARLRLFRGHVIKVPDAFAAYRAADGAPILR